MLICVSPAGDLPVAEFFFRMSADSFESGNAIDRVDCQAEPIGFVIDRQFHWSIDVAFLLVPPDMKPLVLPAISQTMNQPRVTVEIKNDGLVCSEERIEIAVG